MLHGYRLLVSLLKPEKNYSYITKDVEKKVDTSTFELDSPLRKGKNTKVIGLKKDELNGKIITKFTTLRPKS